MIYPIDHIRFADEVRRPGGPGLIRAALLFAKEIAYPDLRPSAYLARLDGWAEAAQARCNPDATIAERAGSLSEFLFEQIGLRGNSETYDDPRNSFVNEVVDRRLGLPIALSAIFLELAARVELPAYGIGLPGHFIVGVGEGQPHILLDPFNGGKQITAEAAAALVRQVTGFGGPLKREWLQPMAVEDILARMLLNLRGVYVQAEDWLSAIAVLDRLRQLQPAAAAHVRDLGLLHYRNGSPRRSAQHLEEYLLRHPDATDAKAVRNTLDGLLRQIARLN